LIPELSLKLNEKESFKAIGRFLNKNCTTISKEVKHPSPSKKAIPMADLLIIASWIFNGNAPPR